MTSTFGSEPSRARLTRGRHGRPVAPVRHVHLGLGAFFRAHQAWYTDRATDAAEWGVAAFAGRSPQLAAALADQECLYTLVTRGSDADSLAVVSAVSRTHGPADSAAWHADLAATSTAVVSLTITEAGYRRNASGGIDLCDQAVASDIEAWRAGLPDLVRTAPARLAIGFAARRTADAGPVTLLSCDNLPGNSEAALRVAAEFAAAVDEPLADWIMLHVRPVNTLVDRITPATTARDIAEVAERTGHADLSPVVTEPYSEWVMGDTFAADRPDWESAGALVRADVQPYEQRKLLLLNGAHSLLAYAGPLRGHLTVADAIGDSVVVGWVLQWWRAALPYVALPRADSAAYCDALLERFRNARIRHQLAQIAIDGSQKLRVRVLPVLRPERAAGQLPVGVVRVLGAWVAHLRGLGVPVVDPAAADLVTAMMSARSLDGARNAVAFLDPKLAGDEELVTAVAEFAGDLCR
ncbi:MAG: mannitol dehydrogenase family protein [Streptosporangiaceae bacterium]